MSHENADLLKAHTTLRRIFETTNEYLAELRRVPGPIVTQTVAAPRVEEKLLQLRHRLSTQVEHCNDFCLAFAEFRLFSPSPKAWEELIEREIPVPVTSNRDFRSFIIVLHQVFDESVVETLRRWKPPKKLPDKLACVCATCGQPVSQRKRDLVLPDPLTSVAEILHADKFGQLTILRNTFAAHDASKGDGVKAARKLSQVYFNLIGLKTVARFNKDAWVDLQKAVLQMLSEVLEEVLEVFEKYQESMRKPPRDWSSG